MNPIALCAEHELHTSTHPALRLGELVALVAPRMDRRLDGERLRAILEEYPDRFRVLDAWRRPLLVREGEAREDRPEPWVVAIGGPGDPPDTPRAALTLRESVRWLARGVDPRSPIEVSRWYVAAAAEREAREAVLRRAA